MSIIYAKEDLTTTHDIKKGEQGGFINKWKKEGFRLASILENVTVDGSPMTVGGTYTLEQWKDYVKANSSETVEKLLKHKFFWLDEDDDEAEEFYGVILENERLKVKTKSSPPSSPKLVPVLSTSVGSAPSSKPGAPAPSSLPSAIEFKSTTLTGFKLNGLVLEIGDMPSVVKSLKDFVAAFPKEKIELLKKDSEGLDMWPYAKVIHHVLVKEKLTDLYPILTSLLSLRKKTSSLITDQLIKIDIFKGKEAGTVNKTLIRCCHSLGCMIAGVQDDETGNLITNTLPKNNLGQMNFSGSDMSKNMETMVKLQMGRSKFEEVLKRLSGKAKIHWDANSSEYLASKTVVSKSYESFGYVVA